MKKVVVMFSFITLTFFSFSEKEAVSEEMLVMQTNGNSKAVNVWCQLLTTREGCASHDWRECTHPNFCTPPRQE